MSTSKPAAMTTRRMLTIAGTSAAGGGIILLLVGALTDLGWLTYFGVVAAATGALWLLCARKASSDPMRKAERRYLREFFPAMAAYVIAVVTIWPLVDRVDAVPIKILIALVPVVPVIFVVRAMVRSILASDELEQRVQLEAISIASLTVGLLSFAAAFMQSAGVLTLKDGLGWVLPALFGVYGVALWRIKRRYRDE